MKGLTYNGSSSYILKHDTFPTNTSRIDPDDAHYIALLSIVILFLSSFPARLAEDMKDMKGMEQMGPSNTASMMKGKMIFGMSCVFCHGPRGEGDSAASMFLGAYSDPMPNNFTWKGRGWQERYER